MEADWYLLAVSGGTAQPGVNAAEFHGWGPSLAPFQSPSSRNQHCWGKKEARCPPPTGDMCPKSSPSCVTSVQFSHLL